MEIGDEVRLISLNKHDGEREREKWERVRGREKDGKRVCLRRTMKGLVDDSVSARIAESSGTRSTLSIANVHAILPRDITSRSILDLRQVGSLATH